MKTIVLFITVIFLSGCGLDYSGDYLYLIKSKKTHYADEDGNIRNGLFGGYGFLGFGEAEKKKYRKVYKYELTTAILNLKQDGTSITGKLIVTNDQMLKEFDLKSGYVDESAMMHLKLLHKPDASIGIGMSLFSLSGGVGEILLNLDQLEGQVDNELSFNMSGAVNVLGGLTSSKSSDRSIMFYKIENSNIKNAESSYLSRYIEDELVALTAALKSGEISKAQIFRDLLVSMGGIVPSDIQTRLEQSHGFKKTAALEETTR